MYARGMTTREIQGHLMELYGLEVSPDLISTVTDAVLETVAEWQNRPLEESIYRSSSSTQCGSRSARRGHGDHNKAVYIALGVQADGTEGYSRPVDRERRRRQVLAAKFMNELRNRGVGDISSPPPSMA